jgi:hypothetical protein
MGQPAQPLPQQGVDLVRRQTVAQFLQAFGMGAGKNAVVQCREGNPFLGPLALDVFMAIDAELGGVGEVGAELQEEWAEVFIESLTFLRQQS